MNAAVTHLRKNVVAYVALFVALGGTSYAAVSLPAGSVGNRQLKNHSITPIKLDPGSIAGYVRDWAADRPVRSDRRVSAAGSSRRVGRDWSVSGRDRQLGPGNPAVVFRDCDHDALAGPCDLCERERPQRRKAGPLRGCTGSAFSPGDEVTVAVICPQP